MSSEFQAVQVMTDPHAKRPGRWWPIVGVALAVLLALLGLVISALLLQHHVVIAVGGDPLVSGVCEMTKHSSCDAVLQSQWGTFKGIPTALWGFFFFAAVFSWYLVVGRPAPERKWWHLLPLAATAAGAGVCAGLAYLMYTQLPEWCPLCAATHAIAGLLFIVTVLLWPRVTGQPRHPVAFGNETGSTPDRLQPEYGDYVMRPTSSGLVSWPFLKPSLRQVVTAVLLAGSLSAAASGEYYRRVHKGAAAEYKQRWQVYESDLEMVYNRYMSEPKVDIPIGPDDSILGPADAPHTLVMFGDYQCEFCRGAEKLVREKMAEHPGHLRLVFKHFPMNRDCNEYVRGKAHAAACATAVTAEAARKLGGEDAFWKMHDELFRHPASFARKPREFVREACERIGLDESELWQAIQTSSAWARVHLHTAQGNAIGVKATPALYLDGRQVRGWALGKFWDYVFAMDRRSGKVPTAAATRPAGAATQPASP